MTIDSGAGILFTLVPIFIGLVFTLVMGILIFNVVKGIGEWAHNNSLPVSRVDAVVLSKRVETRTSSSSSFNNDENSFGSSSQTSAYHTYYITFQNIRTGERHVFTIKQKLFDKLIEKDSGTLVYQGTRFHNFYVN